MDEATVQSGDNGEWVTYLQQLLAQAGYDPGPVDGAFGNGTYQAVLQFQQAQGLTADGVVGPATWAALTGAGAPAPTDPGPTTPTDPAPAGSEEAVPQSLVDAGAPPLLSQWTDEQKQGYFEGKITQRTEAGTPEAFELVAIADPPSDGGQLA